MLMCMFFLLDKTMRRPVVSFDRTGCPEFIASGENGWVAKDGDSEGFMHGIEFFYGKFKSGEMQQLRRTIADRYFESFSAIKIVRQYCDVYEKCIGGRS